MKHPYRLFSYAVNLSTALPVCPTQITEIFPEDICWQITHVVTVIIIACGGQPISAFFQPVYIFYFPPCRSCHMMEIFDGCKGIWCINIPLVKQSIMV